MYDKEKVQLTFDPLYQKAFRICSLSCLIIPLYMELCKEASILSSSAEPWHDDLCGNFCFVCKLLKIVHT